MASTDDDRLLLRQAEIDAERLVSLLRIAVGAGLLLSFVMIVAPSRPLQIAMLQRQWIFAVATMCAYLSLGLFLYLLARKDRLRHWMIWPAIVADSGFLLFNIWVGLQNTGLPGLYLFALPPVWLVPLVLAFGVLRLDPVKQAFGLVLVIIGLAVLMSLSAGVAPVGGDAPLRLFLSMPPNLIRLTMIALAGVVLIIAARRMRDLLTRSMTEARQKANLTRYLPTQVAGRLASDGLEALRKGQHQAMTVLFIDIRGFTRWSQHRDPMEIGAFVTEYRSRVASCVTRTGGLIDKFMGDAVMVLFEGADHARRGLHCAELLDREMADWSAARGERVRVGIGVHCGTVFSGVVGDTDRLEYSVFGDTVNIAARLEQLTRETGSTIVVSRQVLDESGVFPGDWQELPQIELRGRHGQIALYGRNGLSS